MNVKHKEFSKGLGVFAMSLKKLLMFSCLLSGVLKTHLKTKIVQTGSTYKYNKYNIIYKYNKYNKYFQNKWKTLHLKTVNCYISSYITTKK